MHIEKMQSYHSDSNYTKTSSIAAWPDVSHVISYTARKRKRVMQQEAVSASLTNRLVQVKEKLRGVVTFNMLRAEIVEFGTSSHLIGITQLYKRRLPRIMQTKHLPKLFQRTEVEPPPLGWLFHPDSIFKQLWNLLILVLLFYVFVGTPWVIAFEEVRLGSGLFYFELGVDCIFFADIVITLNSAYFHQDKLVTSHWAIFKNYLGGLLLVDLVAVFPFFLLENSGSSSNSLVRIVRITKVSRVFRASKLLAIAKHVAALPWAQKLLNFLRTYHGVTRMLLAGFVTLVMGHFVACMWYFSARMDEFGPDTWVVRKGFVDASKGELYLASLYWTFTTLTTVGFGDIQGFTSNEMAICIVWMMFGIGFYSFLIGTLASVLSSIDTHNSQMKEYLREIEEFCEQFQVAKPMQKRMKKHATGFASFEVFQHDTRAWVLAQCSRDLRRAVCENMNEDAVRHVPFLYNQDFVFLTKVVPRLEYECIAPKQVVYRKGSYAECVHFIVQGRVGYKLDKYQIIFKELVEGGYFGEIELLHDLPRRFTVATTEPCAFLVMCRHLFAEVLEDYPKIGASFKRTAAVKFRKDLEAMAQTLRLVEWMRYDQGEQPICGKPLAQPQRPPDYGADLRQLEQMHQLKDQLEGLGSAVDSALTGSTIKKGNLQPFSRIFQEIQKSARLVEHSLM